MRNRLVLYLYGLWKRNRILLMYLNIGYLSKCNRGIYLAVWNGNIFTGLDPCGIPLVLYLKCLWESAQGRCK